MAPGQHQAPVRLQPVGVMVVVAVPWRCAQRAPHKGKMMEQGLGRGWHRVRPRHSSWPRHKCRRESHQMKPSLVSVLMPSSRAQSLVLLFKRTCLSQAGRPTREHSLLRGEKPSCVLRVAFLGRWKGNCTTEPSQRQPAPSACRSSNQEALILKKCPKRKERISLALPIPISESGRGGSGSR